MIGVLVVCVVFYNDVLRIKYILCYNTHVKICLIFSVIELYRSIHVGKLAINSHSFFFNEKFFKIVNVYYKHIFYYCSYRMGSDVQCRASLSTDLLYSHHLYIQTSRPYQHHPISEDVSEVSTQMAGHIL